MSATRITADSTDDAVRSRIAEVYAAGPWQLGWTYIYGQPESRFDPRIVTIGLNPGGGRGDANWGGDAYLDQRHAPDVTNAYFDQDWGPNRTKTALQKQFAQLRKLNERVPPAQWLTFQFIPFRSPKWSDLVNRQRRSPLAKNCCRGPWPRPNQS